MGPRPGGGTPEPVEGPTAAPRISPLIAAADGGAVAPQASGRGSKSVLLTQPALSFSPRM